MADASPIGTPTYRIFHLNERGGISRAEVIDATNDADAVRQMQEMRSNHTIELWERARFIRKLSPANERPAVKSRA